VVQCEGDWDFEIEAIYQRSTLVSVEVERFSRKGESRWGFTCGCGYFGVYNRGCGDDRACRDIDSGDGSLGARVYQGGSAFRHSSSSPLPKFENNQGLSIPGLLTENEGCPRIKWIKGAVP